MDGNSFRNLVEAYSEVYNESVGLSARAQAINSGNSPLSRDPRARGGFDPRFDKKPESSPAPSAPKPTGESKPTSAPKPTDGGTTVRTPNTGGSSPSSSGSSGGLLGALDKVARGAAERLGGEIGAREGRSRTGNLPILGDVGEKIGRNQGQRKGGEMYDKAKETLGGLLKQNYDLEGNQIDEEPSLGRTKTMMAAERSAENAAGMRGPELTHGAGAKPASKGTPKVSSATATTSSGDPVTDYRSRTGPFSNVPKASKPRALKDVVKGGLKMSYEPEGNQIDEEERPFPHEKVERKQKSLRDKGGDSLERRMKMGLARRRATEAEKTGGSQRDAGKGWYHAKEEVEQFDEAAKRTPKKVRGAKDPEKEMAGRSDAGKRISGDENTGPNYYTKGRSRGAEVDAPTQPGQKPKGTPKLASWEKDDIQYRKANLKAGKVHKVGGERGLPEDFDYFDSILEYLVFEGHVDTNEEALYIMANMSENLKESIIMELTGGKGHPGYKAGSEVELVDEVTKLGAEARRRAVELGAKRRRTTEYKQGGNRRTGRKERRYYDLANRQSSTAADLETQKMTGDTGAHGHNYYERIQKRKPENNPKHEAHKETTKESYDLFDYLLEYLVAEGYADTNESAIAIMANMSEDWKQSIIEQSNTLVTPEQRRADEEKYGMNRTTPVPPKPTSAPKKPRRMPL